MYVGPSSSAELPRLVEEEEWDNAAWARKFLPMLSYCKRTLRIASPCCGLNGPVHALLALRVLCNSTGDYDTNIALHGIMESLCGASAMCGVMSGDVSNVPLEDLDLTTEVVFTGPPCPPFSTIGKTVGQLDRRFHILIVIMLSRIHI